MKNEALTLRLFAFLHPQKNNIFFFGGLSKPPQKKKKHPHPY